MQAIRTRNDVTKKTGLLREAVELLMWELSAISNRKWEDLTELKRRKSELVERMEKLDWKTETENSDSLEQVLLRSQITDLEYQSRQKIQVQLQMIRGQIDSLQAEKQSWTGCISNYTW